MNKPKIIEQKANEINTQDGNEYEDITGSDFIKFDEIGNSIEGTVIDKGVSERYGFGMYTIMNNKEQKLRFHGSTQLDDLMTSISVDDYIIVALIDKQNTPKGKMNIFSVKRKKR